MVDDGSTDRSSSICDRYANRKNIIVIHQQNAGLSEARNKGLDVAKGEYITFIDSDDYLAPSTYSSILTLFESNPQYDFIEYSVVKEDGQKTLLNLSLPDHEYSDMDEYWIEGKAYAHSYAWNKIYRRKLFKDVRFPRGKKFEDVYTLPEILREAKLVRTTSYGLYHYTYNREGITVKADGKAWRDLLYAHLPIIRNASLMKYEGYAKYYLHVLNIQISTYQNSGNDSDIIIPTLPYNQSWKLRLLHLIGLRNLCHLFRLIFKIQNLV